MLPFPIILFPPEHRTPIQAMKRPRENSAKIETPHPLRFTNSSALISILLLFAGALLQTLLWIALLNLDKKIFREHGPMENFQVACLFVAGIIWAISLKRIANPGARVLVYAIIFLHVNFFASEYDVRPFGIDWLTFLLKGTFRNSVLAAGWLFIFLLFASRARPTWDAFVNWLATRSAKVMMIAGVFWVLGWIVDKSKPFPSPDQSFMAEELLETNATFFMVVAAIFFLRSNRAVREPQTFPHDGNERNLRQD